MHGNCAKHGEIKGRCGISIEIVPFDEWERGRE